MSEVEQISLMNLSSSSLTALSVTDCGFQGNFQTNIFHLPKLKKLSVGVNPNLIGSLPKYNWRSSLKILGLSRTKFLIDISHLIRNMKTLDELYLRNCSFVGSYQQLFGNLTNIISLDLSYNNIGGQIPFPYWSLDPAPLKLEFLALTDNMLNGPIPNWLYSLPSLQILYLQNNRFTGHIHEFQTTSLIVLDLSNNRMIGEVPSSICNLRSLEVLDLAYNSLNGKLPPCLGTLSGSLSVLDMRMNKLHGMIPATLFGKKSTIRTLNLNGNQLEGLLPPSLLNCKKLQVLDIGNNMINGTFPFWLESLPLLQILILRPNKFHGSVPNPTVRFPFQKLRILDLSGNEFNDNLPAKLLENLRAMMEINTRKVLEYMGEYYYKDSMFLEMKGHFVELEKILTIFTTIDLSRNNFEGEIPKSIGKLKSLKGLNVSLNKLNGSIPPSLGNLSELESLDLSSNVLVGMIPQQLTDITSLAVLNLLENRLVGRIPRGKQFATFESNSYRGNLDLCGFSLSKLCSIDDEAQQPSSADFQQEGEGELTNWFEWMIISIGFGCGLVIGISIGYKVLSERRIGQLMRCC